MHLGARGRTHRLRKLSYLGKSSRQFVGASFLLATLIAWPLEAVAGQLSVTWLDNSTNELGFSVERSTGTTGIFGEVGTTGPGVTTYTDLTVATATTYCYRTRAFNSAGYSNYTNTACATTPQTFGLAVVKVGLGSGTVNSTPAGITCGTSCSGNYASGTAVFLAPSPATGSTFTGWSGGGCAGPSTCTVTVTAATIVTATFAQLTSLAPPDGARDAIYRFYNVATGAHFYTIGTAERDSILVTLPQYQLEGVAYYAYQQAATGTAPVYRFYNVATGTHFYTMSAAERDTILSSLPQYLFEGVAYYTPPVPQGGTVPIYRLYNVTTGVHFYTASEAEKNSIIANLPNYQFEGVAGYAFQTP